MPTFVTTGSTRPGRQPDRAPTPGPTTSAPVPVAGEQPRRRSRRKPSGSLTTSAEVLTAVTPPLPPSDPVIEVDGDDIAEKEVDV